MRRNAMVTRALVLTIMCLVCCTPSPAQARQGRQGGRGAQVQEPAQPPAMDKVTPEIPGVVKAGTKIEVIKFGLGGTDAGVGLSDGSVLVTSRGSLIKVDPDGNSTTLVENTEQAAGLAIDPKGRV